MDNKITIGTWNLCLGLPNKKDYVSNLLDSYNLNVCCLQECEVPNLLCENTLTTMNYCIELEQNDNKKRVGIYIKNTMNYKRRKDLEEKNNHLIVIDVKLEVNYRIINVYRSFSSNDGRSPTERLQKQLDLITNALNDKSMTPIIIGDFNLDFNKAYDPFYGHHLLYQSLQTSFEPLGLIQLINFETWSRFVNGVKRSSIIDHLYTTNPFDISNLTQISTDIGDHYLITFTLNGTVTPPKPILKRDWRSYNVETLLCNLSNNYDPSFKPNDVQTTWNYLENVLINVTDEIVPLTPFTNNLISKTKTSPLLRGLINKKKRLLKQKRINDSNEINIKLKTINKNTRKLLKNQKSNQVRRGIIPGNSKTLWDAVKKAKNLNINPIPDNLTRNNAPIEQSAIADSFAEFFANKVKDIVGECSVKDEVYNGSPKVMSVNSNFMTPENILSAAKLIKSKNCEGYDRIPVRVLLDSLPFTLPILSHLFNQIYEQKQIPEQWKVSKIIPIPKSGDPHKIENYRPISNLCSTTKIFEKMILMRLTQIESENNCSLTGKPQHGFKKNHSTCSLGLTVQSVLSHALDENNYALMASIDLSAAFDVVNVRLLLKRLKIIGLPNDVITLIRIWLEQRMFYVEVGNTVSPMFASDTGTVQGSILGPILYAIFVSPIFDLEKMSNYADDNYVIRWNKNITALIVDMKKSLEAITKWLKDSGLKVNESKTEICLFHRNDRRSIEISVNNVSLVSTPQIKVLGVIFDSKLTWAAQISNTIKKAKMALNAIKIIKKYFTLSEIKTLLTSNFFSILYYNSDIWHLPTLSPKLKQLLLSASANALKLCLPMQDPMTSFATIHTLAGRATPQQYCSFKHSILLHTIYNTNSPPLDWITLNFNQCFNSRNPFFQISSVSTYKIGRNKVSERLKILNNKIKLDWLNLSKDSYKIKCKRMFL